MRSRYSRGGGISYSQQNFLEEFRSAGGLREKVQPIVQPVISHIEPEVAPIIEEPSIEPIIEVKEEIVEVVSDPTPTPTIEITPTPKPTAILEPITTVLKALPAVKPAEKPIRTSNFKSKF